MPESTAHDAAVQRIHSLLTEYAKQQPEAERGRVARNLAVRWLPEFPRTGIDPDLCVLAPAPPEMETDLGSLCLWKPGHFTPRFCVYVVSRNHPHKDYIEVPERAAQPRRPRGAPTLAAGRDRLVRARRVWERARAQPGARRLAPLR